MSKRSAASGTLTFGLVSIPVKFYVTAQAETVSFNMITPSGNRVKQKYVDSVTGEEVEFSQCSKGYEHAKGQYVIFTKDEIKALGESDNGTLEIKEFVPSDSLSLTHVEKTYYLDAGKGGDRAYRLLAEGLKAKNRCAVAQWTNRGRQHLVVVAVENDALVAHQMFYASEIRDFELDCATFKLKDVEIDLACKLIDSLSTDTFDSTKYVDSYKERVEAAIETKLGGGIVTSKDEAPPAVSNDLLAALQASLSKKTAA